MLSHAPARRPLDLRQVRWDCPAAGYLLPWPTLAVLWITSRGARWHLIAQFTAGS